MFQAKELDLKNRAFSLAAGAVIALLIAAPGVHAENGLPARAELSPERINTGAKDSHLEGAPHGAVKQSVEQVILNFLLLERALGEGADAGCPVGSKGPTCTGTCPDVEILGVKMKGVCELTDDGTQTYCACGYKGTSSAENQTQF